MDNPEDITLRFVTSRDVISAGIRAFEDGFWASHVETLMPDGTLLGAHFNGGVLARPKGYDAAHMEREEYVKIPLSLFQAGSYYDFLKDQLGKPYDTTAIVGMLLHRNWREDNEWFCSELVAAAFVHCGAISEKLASELQHVTPRDVYLYVDSRI